MKLTLLFSQFFNSEKTGGLALLCATIASLVLANGSAGSAYLSFWHQPIAGHDLLHWINDGLMTVFFLLIGLELEREIYVGELSKPGKALLPVIAAVGGIVLPAGIYLLFNAGGPARAGAGIPMATDIAFALGVLSLLGKRVPASLKVFLAALAVIDDLGAIIIIAVFYTGVIAWSNLLLAMVVFLALLALNRMKINHLLPYLAGGLLIWYFMQRSGVHATITGVLLAFAIPFRGGERSPSARLQHFLHRPVAFIIVPLFAMANTAIVIDQHWYNNLSEPYSLGIFTGLVAGKPIGISLFALLAVLTGAGSLPGDLRWKHIVGASLLGGIGFTMSIFITLLAFSDAAMVSSAKFTILISSLTAGIAGLVYLFLVLKKNRPKAS